jgi:hypothetical protein
MNGTLTFAERLLATLAIVSKEAKHLDWSRERLYSEHIDARWVG